MFKLPRVLLALACASLVVACTKPAGGGDQAKPADAAATADKKADANAPVPADLSSEQQQFGYAIGYDIGHSLAQIKDNVDLKSLEKGLEESAAGQTARLTDKQREDVKNNVAQKIRAKQQADREAAAKKNQDDGDKFLADNGKKAGVKTTASGLEYEVITEGKGDHPTAQDKVTVNYKGTLLDGTVFDSSYDRGQPVSFPLGNVIPGWTEGVQLMTPGSKYKFYIPSKLAYGERGAGAKIGPNQTLTFEVELISIDKNTALAPAAPGKPAAPKSK
ncbi:MAG: FKBP-type peptidyl-prolyl cis-trans isomerase [Nevskia sp.]|nr:FKBP-type peptidyl-prolyl cis-trans isomerase [Nevskia sp.]